LLRCSTAKKATAAITFFCFFFSMHCAVALQRSVEGDGSHTAIAFFFFFLAAVQRSEEGDGSVAAVASSVFFFSCYATAQRRRRR
jgi:hypothetical protein